MKIKLYIEEAMAKLKVYDIPEREVSVLLNCQLQPGTYEYTWNAGSYAAGVYFYKLEAGNFIGTKSMKPVK